MISPANTAQFPWHIEIDDSERDLLAAARSRAKDDRAATLLR